MVEKFKRKEYILRTVQILNFKISLVRNIVVKLEEDGRQGRGDQLDEEVELNEEDGHGLDEEDGHGVNEEDEHGVNEEDGHGVKQP